jgi:ferric-dicitrate binding protein FerR (iron transport regulator)
MGLNEKDESLLEEFQQKWDKSNGRTGYVMPNKERVWSSVLREIDKRHKLPLYPRAILFRVACIASVFALVGGFEISLLFSKKGATTAEVQNMVVIAPSGQKSELMLPDGTHVWLNSKSSITYPSDFNLNHRTVQLLGEAFFDVNKSPGKDPFIIEANTVNVKVYGTIFNVKAYPKDNDISVALLEGSVSLLSASTNDMLADLKPNQMGIINKKDLSYEVIPCDAGSEALWHLNKLHFENNTADVVWEKLERWYGVNIDVVNVKSDLTYLFTIKTETLTELLSLINRITPIEYTLDGEEVVVRYK